MASSEFGTVAAVAGDQRRVARLRVRQRQCPSAQTADPGPPVSSWRWACSTASCVPCSGRSGGRWCVSPMTHRGERIPIAGCSAARPLCPRFQRHRLRHERPRSPQYLPGPCAGALCPAASRSAAGPLTPAPRTRCANSSGCNCLWPLRRRTGGGAARHGPAHAPPQARNRAAHFLGDRRSGAHGNRHSHAAEPRRTRVDCRHDRLCQPQRLSRWFHSRFASVRRRRLDSLAQGARPECRQPRSGQRPFHPATAPSILKHNPSSWNQLDGLYLLQHTSPVRANPPRWNRSRFHLSGFRSRR